jgi:hypothetical protein
MRKVVERAVLRKYSGWAYEKEHRIVMLDRANTSLPFQSDALTGVIMGCRMPQAAETALREILEERSKNGLPPVRVYRAVQHPTEYALVIRCEK